MIYETRGKGKSQRSTLSARRSRKVWSHKLVSNVEATLNDETVGPRNPAGVVWSGVLPKTSLSNGRHSLAVRATLSSGKKFASSIEIKLGKRAQREFSDADQNNAIDSWEERGILGTQLGPNKNGKKW